VTWYAPRAAASEVRVLSTPPRRRTPSLLATLLLTAGGFDATAQGLWEPAPAEEIGFPALQSSDLYGITGHVAAIDYDGDGDWDLALSMGNRAELVLLRNDSAPGAPRFVGATAAAGLSGTALGFAVADFDDDGDDDLYVLRLGEDALYLNVGEGRFEDVTATHLPGHATFGLSASPADFDGDGDVDLHVARYIVNVSFPFHSTEADSLLVNDGSGRFRERDLDFGLTHAAATLTSLWTDADGDADLDLLVVHDFGSFDVRNVAYRNDGPEVGGGWRFGDASAAWGFDVGLYGMGVVASDVDGDGASDFLVSSIGRQSLLLGPLTAGATDVADELGATGTFTGRSFRAGWAMAAIDLTGDGYDELYVRSGALLTAPFIEASGPQRDLALDFGDGVARDVFAEVVDTGVEAGVGEEAGRGVIVVDVDGDGAPDLVGGSASAPPRLLLAPDEGRFVEGHRAATVSAPGAFATAVTLRCGEHEVVRPGASGGALGSQPPPGVRWVPVPPDCDSAELDLRWPSGVSTVVSDVRGGQRVVAAEPEWLRMSSRTLRAGSGESALIEVQPRRDGAAAGPGAAVLLRVGDGAAEPLEDLGDGWYRGLIAAPAEAGEQRLELLVDGVTLGMRPTVEVREDAPRLAVYPEHPIERAPWTVTVSDPGAGGVLGVLVDGEPAPVELLASSTLGERAVRGTVDLGASGEEVAIQATVDGTAQGPVLVRTVGPRVDAARSSFRVNAPFQRGPIATSRPILAAVARDANGWPALRAGEETSGLVVLRNGAPIAFSRGTARDGVYTATPDASELVEGARYALEVAGVVVGEPATYRRFDAASELLPLVAPERSRIGFSTQGCYADGQDLLYVGTRLLTAEGHVIPSFDELGLDVDGAAVIEGPTRVSDWVLFGLRCGREPGVGHASVTFDGVPIGLEASFDLYPAQEGLALSAETTTLDANDDGEIVIWPRDADGVLLGSGLDLCLETTPPDLATAPEYCAPGRWCATLRGPRRGGLVEVSLCLGGEPTGVTASVEFAGSAEDAGADGGADGRDGLDGAVGDVRGDGAGGDAASDARLDDGSDAPDLGAGDGGEGPEDIGADAVGDSAHADVTEAGGHDGADAPGLDAPRDGSVGDAGVGDAGDGPRLDAGAEASGDDGAADVQPGGAESVEFTAPGCGCGVAGWGAPRYGSDAPRTPLTSAFLALFGLLALAAARRRQRDEGRPRSRVGGRGGRYPLEAAMAATQREVRR
jgi:hypothetical protein